MKSSQFYLDEKRNNIEIWYEKGDGRTAYFKKTNDISYIITKRQYLNVIKKFGLKQL